MNKNWGQEYIPNLAQLAAYFFTNLIVLSPFAV
jgi:hypothetical protein